RRRPAHDRAHPQERRRRDVHRLRQVLGLAPRGAPGRAPADRRADAHRGREGPALYRRLGAQEGDQELTPPPAFGARLARHVERRESQIVVGLDPDPRRLWPQAAAAAPDEGTPAQRAAAAAGAQCIALIDAAGPACVAVKPQLACFERFRAPGREALQRTVEHAPAAAPRGVADGKRGDIDVTAAAYADALFDGAAGTPFGDIEGLRVDAATINPYMGADTLVPHLQAARARGAGILVLVRTSNPGASDLMDLELASGGTMWEHVAGLVDALGEGDPIADVGAVVGPTAPCHL